MTSKGSLSSSGGPVPRTVETCGTAAAHAMADRNGPLGEPRCVPKPPSSLKPPAPWRPEHRGQIKTPHQIESFMNIRICAAKLHNVYVTEANPDYKGSITIGKELLEASGIKAYQMVIINNGENGDTWQTYAMPGKKGQVCLNGRPPSHHFKPGDQVIILAEVFVTPEEYPRVVAKVVFVDKNNNITGVDSHTLGEL